MRNVGLLAGVEEVGDYGGRNGSKLSGDGVPDVSDRAMAVDEVKDLVRVESGFVLHVGEALVGGSEEGDAGDALGAETVEQDIVVLVGERAEGSGAKGNPCVGRGRCRGDFEGCGQPDFSVVASVVRWARKGVRVLGSAWVKVMRHWRVRCSRVRA